MGTALDSSASSNSGDSSASLKSFGSGPGDSSSGYSSGSFNQGSWASDSSGSASSGSTAPGSWGSQLPIWLWILLICLCCCCHAGGIGAMMGGKGKPKKKKSKKVAPASTTLKKALAKGATKLDVASDAGFKIGDLIDVGPGTPEHEVNTVKAFGSIICATPLQNDHPAGNVCIASCGRLLILGASYHRNLCLEPSVRGARLEVQFCVRPVWSWTWNELSTSCVGVQIFAYHHTTRSKEATHLMSVCATG